MRDIYRFVVESLAKDFELEKNRTPKNKTEAPLAASLIVQKQDDRLVCGALSDCILLIETKQGLQKLEPCAIHAALDNISKQEFQKHIARGLNAKEARDVILPIIKSARLKANAPDGYACFSTDTDILDKLRLREFMFQDISKDDGHILMMTDGFYALVETYNVYTDETLIQAAKEQDGLKQLGSELRRIEEEDAGIRRYPRLKKSDDATALLMQI